MTAVSASNGQVTIDFELKQVDLAVYARLTGSGPVSSIEDMRFDISVIPDRQPAQCPSPLRHPIQWLRWNPFMKEAGKRIELHQVSLSDQ